MKRVLTTLFLTYLFAQTMMAQLTSLGLVEESNILKPKKEGIKYRYMNYIPELSFVDEYLYVATPDGLYRCLYKTSSEWEKMPLTDDSVLDFEVHGDTLVAITRDQVLYSLDGGQTAKSSSIADIIGENSDDKIVGMAIHPHDAQKVFVAIWGSGLWITCDGGTEWKESGNGKRIGITRLFFNPYDTNSLVGIYNNTIVDCASLLFSNNEGNEWNYCGGEGCIASNISEVYNVEFHPTLANKAVICGISCYGLSDDGGASWDGVFEPKWGQCVANITDVAYDTRNPNILYGADWGVIQEGTTTIVRSTDGGYTWKTFYNESVVPKGHVLSFDMKDNILALYTYAGGIYLLDVDAVESSISPIKSNGSSTTYYDLMGRPVAHPTRGIYIKDGRKVVIGE